MQGLCTVTHCGDPLYAGRWPHQAPSLSGVIHPAVPGTASPSPIPRAPGSLRSLRAPPLPPAWCGSRQTAIPGRHSEPAAPSAERGPGSGAAASSGPGLCSTLPLHPSRCHPALRNALLPSPGPGSCRVPLRLPLQVSPQVPPGRGRRHLPLQALGVGPQAPAFLLRHCRGGGSGGGGGSVYFRPFISTSF